MGGIRIQGLFRPLAADVTASTAPCRVEEVRREKWRWQSAVKLSATPCLLLVPPVTPCLLFLLPITPCLLLVLLQ